MNMADSGVWDYYNDGRRILVITPHELTRREWEKLRQFIEVIEPASSSAPPARELPAPSGGESG